jgi:hypothetical protein
MDLYRVRKGGAGFLVIRDRARWNADPQDRALYNDLAKFLGAGVTRSLVMFSVRQEPVSASNSEDAQVVHRILGCGASAGLCVTGLWATPLNAFVGLRPGVCPAEAAAITRCVDCDDMNWRVSYSGRWMRGVFAGASDETLTYTDEPGAAARFSFEGTAIEYIFSKAYNRGIAEIVVDGGRRFELDLYSPRIEMQSRHRFEGFRPGAHTIEIRASGRRRDESQGAYIDVDALRVPRDSRLEAEHRSSSQQR